MNTTEMNRIPEQRRARWPFQRHTTTWSVAILTLLLLGLLLPADAQDPDPGLYYPKDANVSLGATVNFLFYPNTTNPPLVFQWQHDGTDIPGATKSFLIISNASLMDAGGYRAFMTNASGAFTNTRTAILTVEPTFYKLTGQPIVTDREASEVGLWCDYDNDGYMDLFVGNSINSTPEVRNSLYHNDRNGTFSRVTNTLTSVANNTWGCCWVDYDNDGKPDLLTVPWSTAASELYHSEGGGQFTRVQSAAFVGGVEQVDAAWADLDGDGWVDPVICTWQLQKDLAFRNMGNGQFRSLSATEVGALVTDFATTGTPSFADFDNDGSPDLYVGCESGPAYLFHNQGNGRFEKVQLGSLPSRDYTVGGVWVDYNNDGFFDLLTSGRNGFCILHKNLGGQTFEDVTSASGLVTPRGNFWGPAWGDYDNDGDLDLFIPNYSSTNMMYLNNGNGTFTPIDIGSPLRDGVNDECAVWVDYDNDGFLDLFVACGEANPSPNLLYRNNLPVTGNTNHWLKVKLTGTASNRMGIGAQIRVRAIIHGQEVWQLRQIASNGAFGSGAELLGHFGLGDATVVDRIIIEWPSGNVQELSNVGVDRVMSVTEAPWITPARPTVSINGAVTLTATLSGTSYQWYHDGAALANGTTRILNLTNTQLADAGHYSVVVSTGTATFTNSVYLVVDSTFTKIKEGPVVADRLDTVGGSWVDIDQDGYIDLVVWNGGLVGAVQTNGVFRNNRVGGFERLISDRAGDIVGITGKWWLGVWGDLDRDGDVDCVAVKDPGPMNYFLNDGSGTFLDWKSSDPLVTDKGGGYPSLGDYDNDGLLDLFVGSAWADARIYTNRLYHGIGGGRFEAVTTGPIATDRFIAAEAQAWSDYDGDGDLDLIVTSPELWQQNPNAFPVFLYRNDGAGQFTRITNGVIPEAKGLLLVPAWADYDNDGKLDLFLSNYDGPSKLFHNEGNSEFTSQTIQTGPASGYAAWGDFDNDGDLDLVLATGQAKDQTNLFFLNEGGQLIRTSMGSLTSELGKTSPIIWGDYDNDGFLDLFVGRAYNEINSLFHNNGNSNHWIMVNLKGTTSNTTGIGAKVRVLARIGGKNVWQMREISGGNRYQSDPRAHFGLGNSTLALTVRIEWPSGTVQELKTVAADQILQVVEPRRPVLAVSVTPTQLIGTLTADTNQVYQLHVSDDLASGWSLLTTVSTDASGKGTWLDSAAASQGRRFYRAVKTP